jgi:transposase
MGSGEHRCEWRDQAEDLAAQLGAAQATITEQAEIIQQQGEALSKLGEQLSSVQASVEKLQRHAFGQRSEKMPPVAQAIRDPVRAESARISALQKRRENAEKKRQLVTRKIEHKVREDQKTCPKCGGHDFSRLGGGDTTELYDLVPGHVERQLHVQEKLRCHCGETIITADPPAKVYDKARFGPTFIAQVVVSKCADSLPLYRQAKAYRRAGVQVDDSTLGQLFHRAAEATKPLSDRLLQLVSEKEIVQADETTQRVQAKGKTRTAWLWSFIARDEAEKELISYVFSRSRSGETPLRVLGDTLGKLVADAYSGYNKVTLPGGRERAGCLAHLRRKFFDAQSTAPELAKIAMDYILDVYRIERAALDADLLGTPEHLAMRQTQSSVVMEAFKAWLDLEEAQQLPKSPIGEAIGYALSQWDALTLFLTDPHLPIDNNASERALRVAALGRNYADVVVMRSCRGTGRPRARVPPSGCPGRPHNQSPSRKARTLSEGTTRPRLPRGSATLSSARFFIARSASTY